MFNLLPKQYIQENKVKRWIRVVAIIMVVELIIVSVWMLRPFIEVMQRQYILSEIEEQIKLTQYDEVIEVVKALDESTLQYEQWEKMFGGIASHEVIGISQIDIIISNLPLGVMISTLELDANQKCITIEGFGIEPYRIMEYIERIQSIYTDVAVTFSIQESLQDHSYYGYSLKIPFEKEEEDG